VVNWVEGWLDYYASPDREIDVLFVYYDELKREPRYIRRIAEFHGLGHVDVSRVPTPEPGKLHFRVGEHEQWCREFSKTDQRLVEKLIQKRLLQGFDAAAASHAGFIKATADLSAGHPERAARAALDAIVDFPNHRPAYKLFLDAAAACGVDGQAQQELVEAHVGDGTVADQFIYRYLLIDACASLIEALADDTRPEQET
jgi:hypothetical protein